MENEEENLEIAKNQDLNEEAEYAGNKQDLEKMLLDAQRYLNIFHQIHIFNDRRKAEFEQSLIDIPAKLRAVLMNLPGGRVLIEHIEECEIKRGLRASRTIFENDDPISQTEKELEKASEVNKEFTKAISDTIADTMDKYNKSLLQMNAQILTNSKNISQSTGGQNTGEQVKMLAEVLRENNQQQMEMVKTFGSTLSQAILMSQKEIFSSIAKTPVTNPIFNETIKKETPVSQLPPKNETSNNVTPMPERGSNIPHSSSVADKESRDSKRTKENNSNTNRSEQINVKSEKNNARSEVSYNTYNSKNESPKIYDSKPNLNSVVHVQNTKQAETPKDTHIDQEIDIGNMLKETNNNKTSEKRENKPSVIGSALQKIKSAITEPADDISIDKINITPISLRESTDDLTESFSNAFSESKKTKTTPAANEEKWEYVDEDGNPINPTEWEYVDEDGNPIDPTEWEYVDEDGNPIDPTEWEYVDENGNPIAK